MTMTPIKAIRLKCLDCSCGSRNEVANCTFTHCPLYPFRGGNKPHRMGKTSRRTKQQSLYEDGDDYADS